MGFPRIRGAFVTGPHNKDHNFFGVSIGAPYLRKLPYTHVAQFHEDSC